MKSSIRKSTYKAIYRLLDRVSPVNYDCGKLCDAACCNCGGDAKTDDGTDYEMGIYLLPGEEKLFTMEEDWLKWSIEDALDYDFPDSWFGDIYFVRCKTPPICPRPMRPLQCRFFPLAPHLTENDELTLILCTAELPYSCPLITHNSAVCNISCHQRSSHSYRLNDDFIRATYTVWTHLIKDKRIYDLVRMDSDDRIEAEETLTCLFP